MSHSWMADDPMWVLFDRYFTGACSPDELEQIAQWIGDDPARMEQVAAVRRIWDASVDAARVAGTDPGRFDVKRAWGAVHGRMIAAREQAAAKHVLHLHPSHRHDGAGTRKARVSRWPVIAAAAVVIAATAATAWWRVGRVPMDGSAAADVAMREYGTARGQRSELLLADGTRVVLNVTSRLRVPETYGRRTRDVYLDGEAFFDVAHNAKAPFRVHAGGALAEDLGTAFLVRAYPEEAATTVVVSEGKVALRASGPGASRGVALVPRQLGRLDASRLVNVVSDVDVEQYLAWQHAQLAFKRTPLIEVVRELERWYDIDVAIDDPSLAAVPVSGVYANRSVDGILGDITRSLDARYTREGTHVRLSPSRSTP